MARIPSTTRARRVFFGLSAAGAAALPGCGESHGAANAPPAPLQTTAVFGEVGLSPSQFTYPRAIDTDGTSLWVIDKAAHVQRLSPTTGKATAMWSMPDSVLGKPCGVTIGPDGLVYIPDTHYHRVMVYKPPAGLDDKAELVSQWGEFGEGPGQFIYPTDVAFLTGKNGSIERIYVTEYGGNDRISAFGPDHRFLFSFGKFGEGADPASVEFTRPQSIQVDAQRRWLVATDACSHRVGVFTLDGALVRWIGSAGAAGSGTDQFAYPYGLALRPDGTALVTEFGNHRIHHIDLETGATVGIYGRPGRGEGELTNPWALTVLGDTVYVLDSNNARVQGFRAPPLLKRPSGAVGGMG